MGDQPGADRAAATAVDRSLSAVVSAPAPDLTPVPAAPPHRSERSRRSFVKVALATADFLALITAIGVVSFWIKYPSQLTPLFLVLPLWAMLTGFYGLYRRDRVGADNATLDEIWPIFHCVTVATWLVFVLTQLTPVRDLHGGHMAAFWVIAIVAVPIYRSVVRAVLRSRTTLKQNAVIVGAGLVGQEIARKVMRQQNYGLDLVGFVDADPLPLHQELTDVPVLGARPMSSHGSSRSTTSNTSCSPSPPTTRPASGSCASATSWACRSTSCLASSRSWAAARRCTRSKERRCSG